MAPNWQRFKSIVEKMNTEILGATPLTIVLPASETYDFATGNSVVGDEETFEILVTKCNLNKNDFDYIPEGFRQREVYRIHSQDKLERGIKILDSESIQYEIIVPSVKLEAGGLNHCFKTYIARVENQKVKMD